MGLVFRIYINALMKGNPIAVAITVLFMVALSVGPFYEGISRGDPAALAMMACVAAGFAVVIAVSVVDARKNRKPTRPGSTGRRR